MAVIEGLITRKEKDLVTRMMGSLLIQNATVLQYFNRRLLLHQTFQRINRTLPHKSNHGNPQCFRLKTSFAKIKVKLNAGGKNLVKV